jgi:hypothetical protein
MGRKEARGEGRSVTQRGGRRIVRAARCALRKVKLSLASIPLLGLLLQLRSRALTLVAESCWVRGCCTVVAAGAIRGGTNATGAAQSARCSLWVISPVCGRKMQWPVTRAAARESNERLVLKKLRIAKR